MPSSFFLGGYDYNGTLIPINPAVPATPSTPLIPAAPQARYRPTSGSPNFYRDCYVIDDTYMSPINSGNWNFIFMANFIVNLFNIQLSSSIEDVTV